MKENFACQGPFVQNTVCFMILLLCQGFVQSTRTHKMKCAIIFYEKKKMTGSSLLTVLAKMTVFLHTVCLKF